MDPADSSWLNDLVDEIRRGEHPSIDPQRLRSLAPEVSLAESAVDQWATQPAGLEHLVLEIRMRIQQGEMVLSQAIADFSSETDQARQAELLAPVRKVAESDPCLSTRKEAEKVLRKPDNYRL